MSRYEIQHHYWVSMSKTRHSLKSKITKLPNKTPFIATDLNCMQYSIHILYISIQCIAMHTENIKDLICLAFGICTLIVGKFPFSEISLKTQLCPKETRPDKLHHDNMPHVVGSQR